VHINLREREGRLNGHIANRVSSFQVIKSFGRETGETLQFLRKARLILRQRLGVSLLDTGFAVTCGLISGTCITVLLWIGASRVRSIQVIRISSRETGETLQLLRKARLILRQRLGVSLVDTGFYVTCGLISGTCITALLWIGV